MRGESAEMERVEGRKVEVAGCSAAPSLVHVEEMLVSDQQLPMSLGMKFTWWLAEQSMSMVVCRQVSEGVGIRGIPSAVSQSHKESRTYGSMRFCVSAKAVSSGKTCLLTTGESLYQQRDCDC